MDQPVPSPPPGDGPRRRTLFSGRDPAAGDHDAERRVEELMAAYQATIQRQLEEGMRRIQLTASSLMHEIASEVWRTAGGDKDEIRSKILQELSRDQALRSLIAHSDERFQALAVRTARLEDTLDHVAQSVRGTREQLTEQVAALGAAGTATQDTNELRSELAEVMRRMAASLATLAERDQEIVDAVRDRVREHGELVTQETTRISAAMESYVQHGVEAVGQLAGSVDAQFHALATRDDQIAERIRGTVEEQMTRLAEQLQLVFDRLAIDTASVTESVRAQGQRSDERLRAVAEYLHLLNERVDVVTREGIEETRRTFEARVLGLAQLVRSDSEALRRELVRTAEGLDARTASLLDERLATVSGAVQDGTVRMIDELARRQEETAHAVRAWIDDALARLEVHADEQTRRFDGRTEETISAIDRSMVRISDTLEGQFERLGRVVGEHTAQAADLAIGERLDGVLARLQATAGTVDEVQRAVVDGRVELERTIEGAVDQRFSSLARLVRSDNETLAQQIVADQDATKQALRAMKELQANLPAEVIGMVEQRFASLAESIERSNEMLAKRIDRMGATIGERYDNDIQVVIDRMGDAMHALASLGRTGPQAVSSARPSEPRIELE
jgi:ABC-type transporter Mla subunit MlaD